jgi:5'-deoxynucleotidase YfbR-like HD superfamily hydrolase
MRFAQIERAPRYDEKHIENDAEHSFMVALIASELAAQFYPELDNGRITQFAIIHDLPELKTGDAKTFNFTPKQMEDKKITDHIASEQLIDELPVHTGALVRIYEEQLVPEARFVKAVDKLAPVVVDILGAGKTVMKENYNVTTIKELRDSHFKLHSRIADSFKEFPLIVEAHESLCRLFQEEFEAALLA